VSQHSSNANKLFYGDNLHVLRDHVADESVDLIYLDPPFNSKRDYNLLFKTPKGMESDAQITAFEDSWHWAQQAEDEFKEIVNPSPELMRRRGANTDVADLMRALRSFLKENDMLAYLTMMCNRLLELHRVLKPTGSLYLHCDPTASHYLKLVLDGVFGKENYRNEITWKRRVGFSSAVHESRRFGTCTDIIFFYAKGEEAHFAPQYNLDDPDYRQYIEERFTSVDENGRRFQPTSLVNPAFRPNLKYEYKGFQPPENGWMISREKMEAWDREGRIYFPKEPTGRLRRKSYADELKGMPIQNLWTDISEINSQAEERLGYPTQKPLALLERIISASSNEGDVVLDPFCGCGTAVHAAEKLHRRWIGIDITHLSVSLIEKRMKQAFPYLDKSRSVDPSTSSGRTGGVSTHLSFEVIGIPQDFDSAKNLAERDKYQFQFWACTLVNAQPYKGGKKGADGGVDGIIYAEVGRNKTEKILVSVKGGANISNGMIRDLQGAMDREKAIMGLFITLTAPTKPMIAQAVSAGHYENEHFPKPFPKLQILSIEGLLNGTERALYPDLSMGGQTFMTAKKEKKSDEKKQLGLI
jgi:site-specific DNA-methyltransferase (adenine-specific)